jgi:hypothetical protein
MGSLSTMYLQSFISAGMLERSVHGCTAIGGSKDRNHEEFMAALQICDLGYLHVKSLRDFDVFPEDEDYVELDKADFENHRMIEAAHLQV